MSLANELLRVVSASQRIYSPPQTDGASYECDVANDEFLLLVLKAFDHSLIAWYSK
jgi:hypothetical protein